MKIISHLESHIVELSDGRYGKSFPGDIDVTLGWLPTTELRLSHVDDDVAPQRLINADDGTSVRVRPFGGRWPEGKVKQILEDG